MEIENPFKENVEYESNNEANCNKELATLKITSDKYKPIVINGVSIPSVTRIDSDAEPFVVTESRKLEDLTQDEIDWLNTNINFIVDKNGEFIPITSGNQYVFYQTLLKIQYYIHAHNIPSEFFDGNNENSRYYKIWNIGYLIDNNNYNPAFKPEFRICVDVNMSSEVETRDHAIHRFNHFTHNLFKGYVNLVEYKAPKMGDKAIAKVSTRKHFLSIEDFEEWIKETVLSATENPSDNNILAFIPGFNPLYLNSKVKTLDTFSFYANPKAWISQRSYDTKYVSKFNILIFPELVGDLTITTYYSAAKTIEVEMENMSNRLKSILQDYVYKKA